MNQYELMASRIEQTFLDVSKIQARVWEAKVTPAVIRYQVTVGSNVKEAAVTGLASEIAYNIGAASVRIYRAGGQYYVEVPRDVKRQLALTEQLRNLARVPPYTGLLGMQTDAAPLLLRIDSPDVAHLLLAGTTGSGKTALLRTLLCSLALYNQPGQLNLALIDPKGRGLAPFAPLPHVWRRYGVIVDPDDAETLLGELVAEMERRDRLSTSDNQLNLPRIVIAIDELADLLDSNKAIGDQVQRLTQRGREAGLHVVVATQRPTAALVGSMLKANLPVRLVGKVVSPEEAKIATGIKETGAEKLQGRGDFLCVAGGALIRFQAAYADGQTLDGLVALAATSRAEDPFTASGRRRRSWAQLPHELPEKVSAPQPRPLPERASAPAAGTVLLLASGATGAEEGGAPVHQRAARAENASGAADAGESYTGAPVHTGADAPLRGALPRRPGGPNATDRAQIRLAYSELHSLNKTCEWAYGSKGPLTLHWIKAALTAPVDQGVSSCES